MTIRFALFCLLILAVPAGALVGDLNGDGIVNFDDYFLFADYFGQRGTPEAAAKAAQTTPERPPEHTTWTSVIAEIEKATYWLGYTAKPRGSTRYYVTFVGTGFAVDHRTIATNYHVGRYIDDQISHILARDNFKRNHYPLIATSDIQSTSAQSQKEVKPSMLLPAAEKRSAPLL